MNMATWVQILDGDICISHCTNILGKDMNPIILLPAMGKIVGQTMLFDLGICCNLTKGYWMRNNQNRGWRWNGNLYNINKIQYSPVAWRR